MNAITSKAEVFITASTASQTNENRTSQSEGVLTFRAVDDVKKISGNTQKTEYQKPTNEKKLDREQLEVAAQKLQEFIGEINHSVQFHVDEDSGRDVIKVVDKNSGDVIKQYPSEEVLGLVSKLSQTAGKLIDHTV